MDLSEFEGEAYDVVLLMGPLYHLIHEADRRKSIENAMRLLKKGGLLVAAFISNYAPIQDALLYCNADFDTEELLTYLENGLNEAEQGFTTAYFTGVEEAKALMNSFDSVSYTHLDVYKRQGLVCILGITEPALYGYALPEKKPLYAAMLGGAIAGAVAMLLGVVTYAFSMPGITSIATYVDNGNNFLMLLITMAVAWGASFAISYAITKKEH